MDNLKTKIFEMIGEDGGERSKSWTRERERGSEEARILRLCGWRERKTGGSNTRN